jgi:hypothetical protein
VFKYFKFKINDTVQFINNDGHFYRVIGYRLEKSIYLNDEYSSIVYELMREFDGLQVDAEEDELVSVSNFEEFYGGIFEKLNSFTIKVEKKSKKDTVEKQSEGNTVDSLLDRYNDYKRLAILFNDDFYEVVAKKVLEQLVQDNKKDHMH